MYTNTRSCTPAQLIAGILRFPTIYNIPILPRMCSLGHEKHEFRVHPWFMVLRTSGNMGADLCVTPNSCTPDFGLAASLLVPNMGKEIRQHWVRCSNPQNNAWTDTNHTGIKIAFVKKIWRMDKCEHGAMHNAGNKSEPWGLSVPCSSDMFWNIKCQNESTTPSLTRLPTPTTMVFFFCRFRLMVLRVRKKSEIRLKSEDFDPCKR